MKLYLMQLALFQPIAAPVPGYVIQTDDGINILVDTGLPYSAIHNLQGPAGLQLEMHEADYVVNQLLQRKINVVATFRDYAVIDFDEKEVRWAIRVSPHYYNTIEEIDDLAGSVRSIL